MIAGLRRPPSGLASLICSPLRRVVLLPIRPISAPLRFPHPSPLRLPVAVSGRTSCPLVWRRLPLSLFVLLACFLVCVVPSSSSGPVPATPSLPPASVTLVFSIPVRCLVCG